MKKEEPSRPDIVTRIKELWDTWMENYGATGILPNTVVIGHSEYIELKNYPGVAEWLRISYQPGKPDTFMGMEIIWANELHWLALGHLAKG